MSKKEKLINRVLYVPSDLTYEELRSFLNFFGFLEGNKGKTSGSRVIFYRKEDGRLIFLHKPHPNNIVGKNTIRAVIDKLKEYGDL